MRLEDYFEFEKFQTEHGEVERIRIKGHRIALENVLEYYNSGRTAEEIQRQVYPALTLEQVYATITYYLHHKAAVEEYLAQGVDIEDVYYREYLEHGPYWLRDEALKRRALSPESSGSGAPP